MDLHKIICSALPAGSRRGTYLGAPRYTFNCRVCVQQGYTVDKRRRGSIFLDSDGSTGYSCFNCQTNTRQFPDKPLTQKMRMVLQAFGMTSQDITKLNFQLLAAARAKSYPPAVSLPTGLQSIQDWIDQNCLDMRLLAIAELFLNNEEQCLADYYWTPDSNGMDLDQYVVAIDGTTTFPTGWWAHPMLDLSLPVRTHKGIEPEPVELEIPQADLDELRRLIEAEESEDDK